MKKISSFKTIMKNQNHLFTHLSTYTGYVVGLIATWMFLTNNPQAIGLTPVARLFLDAAKISQQVQKDTKDKLKKPDTLEGKQ